MLFPGDSSSSSKLDSKSVSSNSVASDRGLATDVLRKMGASEGACSTFRLECEDVPADVS